MESRAERVKHTEKRLNSHPRLGVTCCVPRLRNVPYRGIGVTWQLLSETLHEILPGGWRLPHQPGGSQGRSGEGARLVFGSNRWQGGGFAPADRPVGELDSNRDVFDGVLSHGRDFEGGE